MEVTSNRRAIFGTQPRGTVEPVLTARIYVSCEFSGARKQLIRRNNLTQSLNYSMT